MMSLISFHSMACRIPYRIDIFLLECECEMLSEHCMCTSLGSSPCRRYSLLGVAHLLWDNLSSAGPTSVDGAQTRP